MSESRLGLICDVWKQIGAKNHNSDYKPLEASMAEILSLKNDGTFEKNLYGSLKFTGKWKFNSDSTKLSFAMQTMNGQPLADMSLDKVKPTDSIIKLNADTLIIGSLKYIGSQSTYVHDDRYYVRMK